MKRRFKTAFILAAGLGKRLWPYTKYLPKPLLPLWGRPIISYIIDNLSKCGFEKFIINVHHKPESYEKVFPGLRWEGKLMILRYESELLDTGGALKNIEDLLTDDEAILCHNGDILTTIPYGKVIDFHERERPLFTLCLRSSGPERHIYLDESYRLTGIRRNKEGSLTFGFQFTGIYAVETESLKYIEPKKKISLIDILQKLSKNDPNSVKGVIVDEGVWFDLGTKESYREVRRKNKVDILGWT
ncbi:MAG: sugar phosphate nucleotidyltransferase [Desulfobacterota bacterium]|nr:sugar phosphate nucleotidyltransferase [Thermodesulfobacteriota bacterium]MDW8001057.1 sugar phosphate nucleotidyltransferase [Deltaproteobacteria bacterium]